MVTDKKKRVKGDGSKRHEQQIREPNGGWLGEAPSKCRW